ncbi:MAG: phosphoribosylamine--glycine ligase, partial [Desulfovibrio sp.]|nr:phosphoribosylamine--glycine ligase [Desulfovibrio sp.]
KVFHCGTEYKDGILIQSGGRILCVTALGKDLAEAQAQAYAVAEKIQIEDSFYRHDIGAKGMKCLGGN